MDRTKTLAILGGGESGTGAAVLAKSQGYHQVFLSDQGSIKPEYRNMLLENGIDFEENGHSLERIQTADTIIKSPGIPDSCSLIRGLENEHRKRIIDELEFAAQFSTAFIIAVTGTNGKSTVTHLIHHVLKMNGFDAEIGGNMGRSWAKTLSQGDHEIFVLEISSFQLDRLYTFHPNVAVLTNITPDHLNAYGGSFDRYTQSKYGILQNMTPSDRFICSTDDPVTAESLKTKQIVPKIIALNLNDDSAHQLSPIKGGKDGIRFPPKSNDTNNSAEPYVIKWDQIPLKGRHNRMNCLQAVNALVQIDGLSPEQIQHGLSTFKGLPHRMELVGIWEDKKSNSSPASEVIRSYWYNDSKATNLDSARASLSAVTDDDGPPARIIWLVGGIDKGNDYYETEIMTLVREKVKSIIAIGEDNRKIIEAYGADFPVFEAKSMEDAVSVAKKSVQEFNLKQAVTVLLAPACSSFDRYRNFEHRGEEFVRCIKSFVN